jgi:hypothetical protein
VLSTRQTHRIYFFLLTGASACRPCKRCSSQAAAATCGPGSVVDITCRCKSGFYGDGAVCSPCKTCDDQASKSGRQCAAGSTADTVICTCNVGYTGTGRQCTATESVLSTVVILVKLPMSLATFRANEDKYISSVASAANAMPSMVENINVTEVSNRILLGSSKRLLMNTAVQVETSISSSTQSKILIDQGDLNVYLSRNGLPNSTLKIISATSSPTGTQLLAEIQKTGSSLDGGAIAGIVISSVVLALGMVFIGYNLKVSRPYIHHGLWRRI